MSYTVPGWFLCGAAATHNDDGPNWSTSGDRGAWRTCVLKGQSLVVPGAPDDSTYISQYGLCMHVTDVVVKHAKHEWVRSGYLTGCGWPHAVSGPIHITLLYRDHPPRISAANDRVRWDHRVKVQSTWRAPLATAVTSCRFSLRVLALTRSATAKRDNDMLISFRSVAHDYLRTYGSRSWRDRVGGTGVQPLKHPIASRVTMACGIIVVRRLLFIVFILFIAFVFADSPLRTKNFDRAVNASQR